MMTRYLLMFVFSSCVAVPAAYGIPLFARKYNTTCFSCHVSPPLLNDFGERFRSNGFELPGGRPDRTPIQDLGIFPLAFATQPTVAHVRAVDNLQQGKVIQKQTAVNTIGLELFSSSSLGSHFSYFTEFEFELEREGAELEVEFLYLLYSDVLQNGSGALNFRLGKQHLGLPMSHTAFLSGTDPLIYSDRPLRATVTPKGNLEFAHHLLGLAAFGFFPEIAEGLHWELAATAGAETEVDLKDARGIFGSLKQAFDLGAMRVDLGTFLFGGTQRIIREGYVDYPRLNEAYRLGFSLGLQDPWIHRLRAYGQYVLGDDNNIDYWGRDRKVNGGFAGLEAIVVPEHVYAFGRYDFLDADDGNESTINQIDAGLRVHLLSNLILTGGFVRKTASYELLSASTGGGHTHRIVPATLKPMSADDEPPATTPSVVKPMPSDVTTSNIYLGILLTY